MALNLVRNSKVFFTTNVDSTTGIINQGTAFTAANTTEIQILDGFTFSQNTNADTITISEAGVAPVRGQRSFNTSLAPVDFSFSNYLRPFNATTAITAEEAVLWNALLGNQDLSAANVQAAGGTPLATYAFNATTGIGTVTFTGMALTTAYSIGDVIVLGGITPSTAADSTYFNAAGIVTSTVSPTTATMTVDLVNSKVGITSTLTLSATATKFYKSAWAPVQTTYSIVTAGGSNKNQLQKFGMLFLVDQVLYGVDNCALNQVSIDFGLDAIATAAWTGQATQIRKISEGATAVTGTFGNNAITALAGTVGTLSGAVNAWTATYALTTASAYSITVGAVVTGSGIAPNSKVTSVNYNTAKQVVSFTMLSTSAATTQPFTAGATSAAVTNFGGGVYTPKVTTAGYITNKLSTVTLTNFNTLLNAAGATVAASGTDYAVALTGGSITINNNISYITPANLGIVNVPVTYYTGTRAISGSLNAYLKTGAGAGSTGQLLSDLLDSSSITTEPMFALTVSIGGGSNQTKVVLEMPSITLTLPTVDVQTVISTVINFTAQGSTPTSATSSIYDLSKVNDITVRYYAA